MIRYNNIHRQQLFHWIGKHIEDQAGSGLLTDEHRLEYVLCLEGALRDGLWLKTPKVPDYLGDGSAIKVSRPIVCFTEWSLDQSLPHTTRYGRLGLGFPKRFVLERGGQPVTYVRDHRRGDPYTAALKELARFLLTVKPSALVSAAQLRGIWKHFEYLSHFAKRIQRPVEPGKAVRGKPHKKPPLAGAPKPKREPDPFERRYGRTLHYLEEREWRIVHDVALDEHFRKGRGDQPNPHLPQYYLPFEAGRELFSVVLPDNRTVNMVLNRKRLIRQVFPADAPHVTLLSLQDIGTF